MNITLVNEDECKIFRGAAPLLKRTGFLKGGLHPPESPLEITTDSTVSNSTLLVFYFFVLYFVLCCIVLYRVALVLHCFVIYFYCILLVLHYTCIVLYCIMLYSYRTVLYFLDIYLALSLLSMQRTKNNVYCK